jgi:hypothetical protein
MGEAGCLISFFVNNRHCRIGGKVSRCRSNAIALSVMERMHVHKSLLFASSLLLAANTFAQGASIAAGGMAKSPVAPINYGVLCPAVGRSAMELANARDQGKDMAGASDYVRSNFQSLGLDTADNRVNDIVLALIPSNASLVYQRKDLKPIAIQYAAAGVCAIQIAGDKNPAHIVAIVNSAANCQDMRENVLVSCVAAEISNIVPRK